MPLPGLISVFINQVLPFFEGYNSFAFLSGSVISAKSNGRNRCIYWLFFPWKHNAKYQG